MASPKSRVVIQGLRWVALAGLLVPAGACGPPRVDPAAERKAVAERFLRGVYGCDPSVVDDLASDDIVTSYPVFMTVYGTPALRGRDAVKGLVDRFCQRWTDARLSVHDAVAENDEVVLLWSFRARATGEGESGSDPGQAEEHRWGGITLFRFDESGRITTELGEESSPGPRERLGAGGSSGTE